MQEARPGRVLWITGLSGAGKSTVCREVVGIFQAQGKPVVMLDGDELREILDAQHAHTREERLAIAMRYARLCELLSRHGTDVAIATISMFREVHEWNRQHLPGYLEVFLRVSLAELERRDPKGIYRRARAGEIRNVAGVDLEVDEPLQPDLVFDDTQQFSSAAIAQKICNRLEEIKS
jgi:adenylylsulfate kinase